MKLTFPKEWCLAMAEREGDLEITAGVDDAAASPLAAASLSNVVFGRFVSTMRRKKGVSVEQMAADTDVDAADLLHIELGGDGVAQPRTVYQIAEYFDVDASGLMEVAGIVAPKSAALARGGIRFAARSGAMDALTPEELAALEEFVAMLGHQN